MTVVIQSIGKKGDAGRDGTNGVGVSNVRESLIASPIINLFRANNIDPNIAWSRDGEAAFVDRYGQNGKVSGDTVRQLLANSDDYRTGAGLSFPWVNNSLYTLDQDRNQPDPLGGNNASQITFTSTTGQTFGFMGNMFVTTGLIYRVSIYVKVISGTLNKVSFKNGGSADAEIVDFPQTPSNDWQRFNVVYTGFHSQGARFLFDAPSGCTVQVFRANISEGTKLQEPELIGDNRPVTITNTLPVYRQNQYGYLLEGNKTNLCPNSQEISDWSIGGGAVVSQNPNPDPYGDINTNTLITFAGSSSISITQNVTLTEGETYSVSFFAASSSGSVESLSVQLGGGGAQTVKVTNGYVRQSLQMVAGSQNSIIFNATAGVSGTSFILTGVQVEEGQLSSYIATSNATRSRDNDEVSIPGNFFPPFGKNYTLQISYRNAVFIEGEMGFLFNGSDHGSALILQKTNGINEIKFRPKTGSSVIIQNVQSDGEVFITYDGVESKVFYNGAYIKNGNNQALGETPETTVFFGATDAAGNNPLNAHIKCFRAWDFDMSDDEVKYASEYYSGNRFSDRG